VVVNGGVCGGWGFKSVVQRQKDFWLFWNRIIAVVALTEFQTPQNWRSIKKEIFA